MYVNKNIYDFKSCTGSTYHSHHQCCPHNPPPVIRKIMDGGNNDVKLGRILSDEYMEDFYSVGLIYFEFFHNKNVLKVSKHRHTQTHIHSTK